jgi:hypothetical protein
LQLSLTNTFSSGPVEISNTVTDIRGSEKPDGVVILGARCSRNPRTSCVIRWQRLFPEVGFHARFQEGIDRARALPDAAHALHDFEEERRDEAARSPERRANLRKAIEELKAMRHPLPYNFMNALKAGTFRKMCKPLGWHSHWGEVARKMRTRRQSCGK